MFGKIRVQTFLPYLGLCLLSYLVGFSLFSFLSAGMDKSVVMILLFALSLFFPYIQSKLGSEKLFHYMFFAAWLPIPFILSKYLLFYNLLAFEVLIWGFFIILWMNKSEYSAIHLKQFPYVPFLVYMSGALLTFALSSYKTGHELGVIRLTCVFPLILCMAIFLSIKSTKDADRLFMNMLVSILLLAIIFFFAQKGLTLIKSIEYASGSGRFAMDLSIPLFGTLLLYPTSASMIFSFMSIIAFSYFICDNSRLKKYFSLILLLIFVTAIMRAQGRGSAMAFSVSALVMSVIAIRANIVSKHDIIIKTAIILFLLIGGMFFFADRSVYTTDHERMFIMISDPLSDPNYMGRFANWEEGLVTFLEHPLGVGLWGFHTSPQGDTWDVHNIWLYLGLSYGIVGLAGFIWILISFLKVFLKGLRSQDTDIRRLSMTGISIIVAIVVAGQFSPLTWEPVTMIIVWAPLACAFAAVKINQEHPA
jgi:O-antigen ligase